MLHALLLHLALSTALQASPIQHLVRVELAEGLLTADDLARAGYDVAAVDLARRSADLVATDSDVAALQRLGLDPLVRIRDLTRFYAARAERDQTLAGGGYGAWLTPPFGQGSMGGFWTFAQIESVLDQIAAAYPAIVRPKTSLGTSIQGRTLWMLKVSDNPGANEPEPEVRIDSLHHAREPQSMQCSLYFLLWLLEEYGADPIATYLVNEREVYFVPCVNPDGYVYNQQNAPGGGGLWRKNRRNNGGGSFGVDLNRNYPHQWGFDDSGSSSDPNSDVYRGTGPASEPEVAAMVAFMAARDFTTALSVHTYAHLWLSPWGYDSLYTNDHAHYQELGALATEINGYPYGTAWELLYLANGVTIDQDYGVHGTLSWTPEIGNDDDGFWPPPSRILPLAEENVVAMQRTALAAGAFVRWLSTSIDDAGDGDGDHEAGESVELVARVRNSGTMAPSTPIVITLTTTSPFATITRPSYVYGALAPFTEADNALAPLAFTIASGTPPGTAIPFTLTLSQESQEQVFDTAIAVGSPRLLLLDALEIDVGWQAGVSGDTAVTGLWTRADPIGTSSNGEPCNPEHDATPGAGNVRCFVTGNANGSAGTDDVDSGHTTLLSPPIDLSAHPEARIGYSRWFANFPTVDDTFRASISNDGGGSWTSLENVVGNQNSWQPVEFRVADFVAPTSAVVLRWVAEDVPNNSLVEGGVDDLRVVTYDDEPTLHVHGRPVRGGLVTWNVGADPGDQVSIHGSRLPGDGETYFGTTGALWGGQEFRFHLVSGTVGSNGLLQYTRNLPIHSQLVGHTFYFQAELVSGGSGESAWVAVTIE